MKRIEKFLFKREKPILLALFVLALIIRLIALFNLSAEELRPSAVDSTQYDEVAMNLLNGKGFVHYDHYFGSFFYSWRLPVYPLFLAIIYMIFGHNYLAVFLIQCIIAALLSVIVYYLAKIIFDIKTAFFSALIIAFYQPYINFSYYGGPVYLLSETLGAFLLVLLALFLVSKFFVQPGIKNSIISGLLFGLLCLTRAFFGLFFIFIFLLLLLLKNISAKKFIVLCASFIFGFLLVGLPWISRNYMIHKKFVPFTTQCGEALFSGNNPFVSGGGRTDLRNLMTKEEWSQIQGLSETGKDVMFRSMVKEFLIKNYKKAPKLFFKKALVHWDVYDYSPDGTKKRVFNVWYSIVLMFSFIGMYKGLRSKQIGPLLLISIFLYSSIIAMAFCGEPRYRNTVELFLVIFAAAGILSIYRRFKNKVFPYAIISSIVALNLFINANADRFLDWVRLKFAFFIKV